MVTLKITDDARRALMGTGDATLIVDIDGTATVTPPPPPVGPPRGPLAPLLLRGDLKAGDKLYWDRPRVGQRYTATVLANGDLDIGTGRPEQSPSGAARAVSGTHVDGWTAWRRERDGKILNDLR